jgi:glycosyltransferase involved in cell wall biosynthesis
VSRPRLSIIVPVHNEVGTFGRIMDRLLAWKVDRLDKEIVVVESGSTDGTGEVVETYRPRPGILIVHEDRPRGKGQAVRTGLERAAGDFVLIQDADLEYDPGDYDRLLAPLVDGTHRLVLGSRFSDRRRWRFRRFESQAGLEWLLNLGQLFFAALFNVLYGQRLKDPTTMLKVFTRDSIRGLRFECRRFDFDWELLAKLVRQGIRPLEIPVSYRARSFAEGKKIRLFFDPLTWLRAIVKYRFAARPGTIGRDRAGSGPPRNAANEMPRDRKRRLYRQPSRGQAASGRPFRGGPR